jgi:hypothetical protein
MRALARFAAAGLVLSLAAKPAIAQLVYNPTYFAPNPGTGLTVSGDFGDQVSPSTAKGTSFGARADLGLPMITVGVGLASFKADGVGAASTINFAGTAGYTLMSLPLTGVSVSLHAGVGYWSKSGANQMNVPFGVTLGIKPPSPGVSLEPWVSVRGHYFKPNVGSATTKFGGSAGVNVGLPMGLGFHGAVDYLNISGGAPFTIGVGVHYKFSVPGLGVVPGT